MISSEDIPLENVHIINQAKNKVTKSNTSGIFTIQATVGDTLLFSHVGMKNLSAIVTTSMIGEKNRISMEEKTISLEEVELYTGPKIDAVSLGLIPKNAKKLTVGERRLFTARDGFLDPIINAISGRTKKLKKQLVLETKSRRFDHLKNNYSEYLKETLNISEEIVSMYLSYLVDEEGIENVINTNDITEIHFFILTVWFQFKQTESYQNYLIKEKGN
ncbi:carboxypeptidase-like regulatory domain-containing protein [Tenacibaculum sp. SG-28]|uniref:carboxypeptidase-like regulatory domain-containing protein n=1 Tax=Tenacibaculum sp. SG-28 TaxID=754426 RepID=UPI000CF3E891|nr:carboxypeptidase-like regulatory domain-containing protein [Tenacibaculum sp. SG-28]PQJ21213.1 hypothetical protein BSU00_09540 [Tenacibaculum sp. SG-28]